MGGDGGYRWSGWPYGADDGGPYGPAGPWGDDISKLVAGASPARRLTHTPRTPPPGTPYRADQQARHHHATADVDAAPDLAQRDDAANHGRQHDAHDAQYLRGDREPADRTLRWV